MPPVVHSVRSLGYAAQGAGPTWRLVGQDGGQSVPLTDGRSLFLFSDTLLETAFVAEARQRGRFLGNCAAFSPATCVPLHRAMAELRYLSDPANGPREFLGTSGNEQALGVRLWPEHGIQLGDTVVCFYVGICQAAPGTWGFTEVGVGLARLDLKTGVCTRWMREGDWRPWPMLPNDCHCGVQLLERDGWVYVFCSRPAGLEYEAFLARVRPTDLEEPTAYQYFAGREQWSEAMTDTQPLTACSSEYSVAFNTHLQSYLMTYVEAHSKQLCLRTAPEPWGPYSAPVRAGVVPHREEAKLVSLGFHHPQFDLDDGRTIFISYSQPHFTQNAMIELTFV